ncbi:hypothetical protein H8S33_04880 [Ornithinibacillus sp. BX22]|uniref:Uncharacterized protein n=2 Tax=Ornithinibacillus TaxID=484508 RepID=A0A923L495_9BACI|nr:MULTISPECIES: hypothetical protein [Ornithinibacillus]MBC5636161.1 hypothetical protein [Ornithinibacillus hominis]MBS3681001.1 hypothetical protein [Ornithinibacillus massiliensis]
MKRIWGIIIIITILLAYIIPYTMLSAVQSWTGSFLFWGITGVVIIIANIMLTRDWSE